MQNISLLLRWWWRLYTEPTALFSCNNTWGGRAHMHMAQACGHQRVLSFGANCKGSDWFLTGVAHGSLGTVWEYPSGITPGEAFLWWISRRANRDRSIRMSPWEMHGHFGLYKHEGWTGLEMRDLGLLLGISISGNEGSGGIGWKFMEISRCKIPPTVKIFSNLMLESKILKHDVMKCELSCVIPFLCLYAVTTWSKITASVWYQLMTPDVSVQQVWTGSWERIQRKGAASKLDWTSRFLCTCWFLWKQRNVMVFGGNYLKREMLVAIIVQEHGLWRKYC